MRHDTSYIYSAAHKPTHKQGTHAQQLVRTCVDGIHAHPQVLARIQHPAIVGTTCVCVCVCVCVRVRVCACVFVNVCLYHTCVRLQAISYACLYWKSTEVMDTHTQEHTQTSTHPHLPPTPPTHTFKQASTHKHIQSQGNTPDQKPLQNSLSPAE